MSFQHKGLSGFSLRREGDEVIKWTRGIESTKILKESYMMQLREMTFETMYPIKTVEIKSVMDLIDFGEYFDFRMPLIEADSAFYYPHGERLFAQVRASFWARSYRPVGGFKEIIKAYLLGIEPSCMKLEVEEQLAEASDYYPSGFCHGDFGLANMLIVEDSIHMIDYTPSFIQTPLIDIATLEMSMVHMEVSQWHLDLLKILKNDYKGYADKIDILRKCKVLGFQNYDSDYHRKIFDGIK